MKNKNNTKKSNSTLNIENLFVPTIVSVHTIDNDVFLFIRTQRSFVLHHRFVLVLVGLHVFGEVIGASESLTTLLTREPLLTSVCAKVALQLVRSSERLVTEEPVAHERAESSVPAKMGLQVTGFTVNFSTSWHVTDVLFRLVWLVRLSRNAVWAFAATATSSDTSTDLLVGNRWGNNTWD